MKADFKNKIVSLLLDGIDEHNFVRILFRDFDSWSNISLNEIYEVLEAIKEEHLALYTFMPFCYKFLGIDLFQYYRYSFISDKHKAAVSFRNYPIYITNEFERAFKEYGREMESFLKIRKNLIEQGAHPVNKLQKLGKQDFFEFPSEWNS
jgi:hypothetical protein